MVPKMLQVGAYSSKTIRRGHLIEGDMIALPKEAIEWAKQRKDARVSIGYQNLVHCR